MANFLHGIETKEFREGATPVTVVKTAVIAVVGTAPIGEVNKPILCLTDKDHAQFGPELPGFTIPQQLRAVRDHKAGTVIVINVLDPDTHTDEATSEVVAFNANTSLANLAHGGISGLVLKNQAGTTTYVLGTDYEIVDAARGTIKKKAGGAIPALAAYATYDYADPTAVIAADIIGTTDVAGIRSGMEALKDCFTLFGLKPKILTSPGFSTLNTVRAAMDVMAQQLRAIALADAPVGTTVAQAITGRGPSGAINFNTSSGRMMLLYPHLKVYDKITDSIRLEPYSSRFAALICLNDVTNGYWSSPSNKEILGIVGVERAITAEYNDPTCEANLLNEKGITTIMNSGNGSGIRSWGNRTAAFPFDTHPLNFLAVRRTADVIEESIEMASAKYADEPGNKPNITTVVETAYEFIRTLIKRGATLDGKVWFDPAENPSVQLAAGNYVYCYDFCPPTPQERITWKAYINQNYLAQLAASFAS